MHLKTFLVALILMGSTQAWGQSVTVNIPSMGVKKAMAQMRKQTGYAFVFKSNLIDASQKVSIKGTYQLHKVIERMLQGQHVKYTIQGKFIILSNDATTPAPSSAKPVQTQPLRKGAKTINASGTVTDKKGEPCVGATVTVRGTKTAVVTDANGHYTVQAPEGEWLDISYVGFIPVTVKAGENRRTVMAEDSKLLDDVVVVGYGTRRRADLTGATSSIRGDELSDHASPNLDAQLEGAMPGVEVIRNSGDPATAADVHVRGVTTISDSSPLIIVDGMPANSLNDINPNDVDRIDVLKDAATAAIYGARAAAGVIIVTTKRGQDRSLRLSYGFEAGYDKPTAKPEYAGAVDWMKAVNDLKYNDGAGSHYSVYSEDYINQYAANHAANPDLYPDTDWQKAMLKSGTSHQSHSLWLATGTESLKSRFSINYYKANYLEPNAKYERYNINVGNDYYLDSHFSAQLDLALIYNHDHMPMTNGYTEARQYAPVYAARWSDGTYAYAKDGWNPLAAVKEGGNSNNRYARFRGKLQLNYKPIQQLTISAAAQPNWYFQHSKTYRNLVTLRQLNGDEIYCTNFTYRDLNEFHKNVRELTFQLYANYQQKFGQHSLEAMAGYESYSYNTYNVSATRKGFDVDIPYLDLGGLSNINNGGSGTRHAYRSYFGRVKYDYAGRYLAQVNLRSDGSSRFASGHRWGTFPSLSTAWIVSSEPWFRRGTVTFLKLRGSMGKLGNERIGSDFPYVGLMTLLDNYIPNSSGGTTTTKSAAQITYAYNDITWETTTTYDIGVDLGLFSNRLQVTLDGYYKKTRDMLISVGFPSFYGYNSPMANAADMHTTGWDLELQWKDKIGPVSYGAKANVSNYFSKMGYMGDKIATLGTRVAMKGTYYNEWYGYRSNGIITNEAAMTDASGKKIPVVNANDGPGCLSYVDQDGDGRITDKDRVLLGNSLPQYQYGGQLWAKYKDFDFNLTFNGVGYWKRRMLEEWIRPNVGASQSIAKYMIGNYWSSTNTDEQNARVKYPKLTATNTESIYAMSDFWLFNGAYFRVKNITLGYTVPQQLMRKYGIRRLRFYVSANDLPAIAPNYPKGWDPSYYYSSGQYIMTSYTFGLMLSF